MSTDTLHITAGFIPLLDAAMLIVAREKGFAADQAIDLELVRETSWASIRDRVVIGHFDAAHMLAPMAIAGSAASHAVCGPHCPGHRPQRNHGVQ